MKVLTVGVFDVLHLGHVLLFKHAKELGDYLIVAVQDSDTVLKYKPNANLINSTDNRITMVESIRYVDEVVVYKDVDKFVQTMDFDIFAVGPDQSHEGFIKATEWCKKNGRKVIVIPRTEGISSSMIKKVKDLK